MSATLATLTDIEKGFEPFFARYITRQRNRSRNPQTIYNFCKAARPFQAWLKENDLDAESVAEDDLYRYFREYKLQDGGGPSQGTKRLHAQLLRAAYTYAHAKGHITINPFVDFELPAAPDPDPAKSDIPSEELRAMLKHCVHPKHRLLWLILCFTGMRREEIRTLTWDCIDWDASTITIVGKGSKRRTIPIHPALRKALDAQNPAHVFTGAVVSPGGGRPYSVGGGFEKCLRAFTDRNFHAFRKTLASSLFRNGVQGEVIDKILGWSAAGIRDKYYVTIQPAQLHRAIEKAYLDDPIVAA
jgi:integrase